VSIKNYFTEILQNKIFRHPRDMLKNSSPEIAKKFYCELCDYKCSKQSDYAKHMLTRKHTLSTNLQHSSTELADNKFVCKCGKSYKDRTGLWYHSKKCDVQINKIFDTKILIDLLKQNQEFKEIIIEQNNKLNEQNSMLHEQNNKIINVLETNNGNNITNNNINSNNKTFNLQVFLNEDCKDAMNITDFVKSINLQLSDLENVGKLGYVEGISNIIIKNLSAMDVTKRPVHCTDPKRETIYIKDGDVWEKDEDDNKKLRKMIRSIAFRNCKNTRLFKEKYPDCTKYDSKYSDIYNKIIVEVMGGGPKSNDIENQNKIIRKIAKVMTIDKNIK